MHIAVTGHRPPRLGGYGPRTEQRLAGLCRRTLSALGVSAVNLGMALGLDLAMADACVAASVPFHAYVPFVGQESTWPAASQARYVETLGRAASVTICAKGGYYPDAMQNRNVRMIDDQAELLVSLWDGVRHGGTFNAIHYATRGRYVPLPHFNLWKEWSRG